MEALSPSTKILLKWLSKRHATTESQLMLDNAIEIVFQGNAEECWLMNLAQHTFHLLLFVEGITVRGVMKTYPWLPQSDTAQIRQKIKWFLFS